MSVLDGRHGPIDSDGSPESHLHAASVVGLVEHIDRKLRNDPDDPADQNDNVFYIARFRQGLGRVTTSTPPEHSSATWPVKTRAGKVHFHNSPSYERDFAACLGGSRTDVFIGSALRPNPHFRDLADQVLLDALVPFVNKIGRASIGLDVVQPSEGEVIEIDNNTLHRRPELTITPSNRAAFLGCLLYTSPSPRDATLSRMPSSA